MRITDIFLAFPRLVLALAFVAALGAGIENAVLAISLTAWPPYARMARAETLTIRSSDYIAAVKLQGAGPLRIITRHIWPLCISSLIVRVTLDMAGIILAAAGLGFLGLGAQPPSPEWGAMISEGRRFILDHWWVAAMPGIAIFTVSLAFNLLGDGLRDVLDPQGGQPVTALLDVADLWVRFPTRTGIVEAVRGVSFQLGRERLGIVGESGSGKTMTGRAILRLIRAPGPGRGQAYPACGREPAGQVRGRDAPRPRRAHVDGHAGPEILAQPGDADWRSADRGRPAGPPLDPGGSPRQGHRDARSGFDPRSRARAFVPIRTRCRAAWASAS
jgi:hypothetical protein